MARFSLIVPICVTIVSGCALFDGEELKSDKPTMSAAVTENVMMPAESTAQDPSAVADVEPVQMPRRTFKREEIRRLQTRLREIGLNPGPVDGIAGTKTKSSLDRLRSGCAQAEPLAENFMPGPGQRGTGNSATQWIPSRAETLRLQTELRSTGFDPGPADGVFGDKTKAALAQLRTGCALAKKFDNLLQDNSRLATTVAPAREPNSGSSAMATESGDSPLPAASIPAASSEEVRVLQLRLRDAGFDPGPFDGIMGPKTKLALEQYEASEGGRKIKISGQAKIVSGQY